MHHVFLVLCKLHMMGKQQHIFQFQNRFKVVFSVNKTKVVRKVSTIIVNSSTRNTLQGFHDLPKVGLGGLIALCGYCKLKHFGLCGTQLYSSSFFEYFRSTAKSPVP